MKNSAKSVLFVAAMMAFAVGCQSKKNESESKAMNDTATVIESETIVSGDSAEIISDTAKFVAPDSVKK